MARVDDKVQIGLTEAGDAALQQIMALNLFTSEGDAYKFAAAYALSKQLPLSSAAQRGYGTKFNAAGGLDRDGTLRDVIRFVLPEEAGRPYATAEKLAEMGLIALAQRLTAHESMADILTEIQPSDSESVA